MPGESRAHFFELLGAFMTFLFARSFGSRPSIVEAIQFGALFGLIATLPLYLVLLAIWEFPLSWALVDSAWHMVEEGLGGVILALTMFPRHTGSTGIAGSGTAPG